MKYLILSVLLCAGFFLRAQENIDVVTLKSGTVYKGVVSEYIPDESVTIKLIDGRLMSLAIEGVESVKLAGEDDEKPKDFKIKKTGFFHTSTIGFQLGQSDSYNEVSFAYNMVNGYKHGASHFGAGTGVETFLSSLYIPLFVDYTYSFRDAAFSPHVSGQIGYVWKPGDIEFYDYYHNYPVYNQGFLAGLKFGLTAYTSSNFGWIFSVGYRYYQLTGESVHYLYHSETISYPVSHSAQLHRFNLSLGIVFN